MSATLILEVVLVFSGSEVVVFVKATAVGASFTSVTLTVTDFSAVRPGFPLSVATTVKV